MKLHKKITNFFKKYLTLFIIAFIFIFLFVCDNLPNGAGSFIMDNLKNVATTFTPTTDLFDDGSEVRFVTYFFGMNYKKYEEKAKFFYPSKEENLSIDKDYLSYNFDGVIKSCGKGVVTKVGFTKDNKKYIVVEHAEGYSSYYEGLYAFGVFSGENVSNGDELGIVSNKNTLKIYIYKDGEVVPQKDIVWNE